ncbi:MAG: GHKL domain-containing protein [Puniceicoccales bacterium]|nr:GHKL domain-containing protein [Puniceicoccales bacterium]
MVTFPIPIYLLGSAFLTYKAGQFRRFHILYLLLIAAASHSMSMAYERLLVDYGTVQIILRLLRILLTYWAVLCLFDGRFISKLFVGGLEFTLVMVADFGSSLLYRYLGGTMSLADVSNAQTVTSTISVLLSFFIWMFRSKILYSRGNSKLHLMQTAIFTLNAVIMAALVPTGMISISYSLVVLCLVAASVLLFFCFETMETISKQNQEYALQEQQQKMREEYYQKVETHQREIRTLKHNMTNMLLSLGAYIQEDASAVANREIESLLGQLAEGNEYRLTEHPGLGALLGAKYRQAESKGILCDFDVRVPSDLAIADNDLAVVVGNVLDNAIEACIHCNDKRYIRLVLVYYANTLAMSCENSTDGAAQNLETRKRDKKLHGIGFASIREAVAKYRGSVQHKFDASSFHIELTMLAEKP